jgi:hypothetical protein
MTARGSEEVRTDLEQTKSLDLVLLIQGESVVDPAHHDFNDGQFSSRCRSDQMKKHQEIEISDENSPSRYDEQIALFYVNSDPFGIRVICTIIPRDHISSTP